MAVFTRERVLKRDEGLVRVVTARRPSLTAASVGCKQSFDLNTM
jgi:hypothetical protein